jgi:hypothetical protein
MDSQDRALVTREMYEHWLTLAVTRRFLSELQERRQELVDELTNYRRPSDAVQDVKLVGAIYGLDQAMEWEV